jgi:transglutaminase/protease-like cytokinesis protein 3
MPNAKCKTTNGGDAMEADDVAVVNVIGSHISNAHISHLDSHISHEVKINMCAVRGSNRLRSMMWQ